MKIANQEEEMKPMRMNNSTKWLSDVTKILLFILLFFALSPNNHIYYIIVDWFAAVGFSFLTYHSFKQNKISFFFYGVCAIIFLTCGELFGVQGVYTRNTWISIDTMACTIIFVCTSYEIAIECINRDHEGEKNL